MLPLTCVELWQVDVECAAFANLALDDDQSLMQLSDVLDDREAQPRPADLAAARLVDTVKAFEDAVELDLRDAHAVVGDTDSRAAVLARNAHLYQTFGGRVLDGVIDQVADRLAQQLRIAEHEHRSRAR